MRISFDKCVFLCWFFLLFWLIFLLKMKSFESNSIRLLPCKLNTMGSYVRMQHSRVRNYSIWKWKINFQSDQLLDFIFFSHTIKMWCVCVCVLYLINAHQTRYQIYINTHYSLHFQIFFAYTLFLFSTFFCSNYVSLSQ